MIRIVRVLAPNPGPFTLEGTNTWVVGEEPSVVIDPGPDHRGHAQRVLAEAGSVAAILLTHRHPDHAPGARSLAEASAAPVFAFRPRPGETRLREGDDIRVDGLSLRVIHAPGHTRDHVCFFLEPAGALFTGDVVLGRGTSIVDPPEGDMAAYVRSLERLRALSPRLIYPGHGPVVLDALGKLDEYLAHRIRREEQVLAALGEGSVRPSDIVGWVYGGEVAEAMLPAAERSVLAHLLKLEREGRVVRRPRRDGERWAAVDPRACGRCGRAALPGSRFCRQCSMDLLQERPER